MPTTSPDKITSRNAFLAEVERLLHHGNAPLAIAFTDIDSFDELNATYGRDAGDAVLASWERVLHANLGDGATVFRLGGDEHAVLMPGTSAENAVVLLEEVRGHFARRPAPAVDVPVTASVGVAANPPHGTTAEDLWRAAGEALMRAKRDGRNRVALYVEEKMILKSNYYSKASLERLRKLADSTDRTEASLLRESLDDLFEKYRDRM